MGLDMVSFWIFLAAVTVASLTFVTIAVWVGNRLKERQEFYRFEFRKRLVEKMDAASVASLRQYELELGQRQARQKLLVAAFVIVGTGVGICLGLQFIPGSVWKVGFIPLSIGLSMLAYGFLVAPKPDPGPPPPGWSPESNEKD